MTGIERCGAGRCTVPGGGRNEAGMRSMCGQRPTRWWAAAVVTSMMSARPRSDGVLATTSITGALLAAGCNSSTALPDGQ